MLSSLTVVFLGYKLIVNSYGNVKTRVPGEDVKAVGGSFLSCKYT